jgi:hypothetical protein
MARPLRGQLAVAVVAGAVSTGCAVGLLATSGFLLARASQHPNIVAISVAVVAVRALSVGRGLFRYVQRLSSHDAAVRVRADVRVRVYQRLERLAPAGLREFRPAICWPGWSATWTPPRTVHPASPAADRLPGRRWPRRVPGHLAPAGAVLAAGLLVARLAVRGWRVRGRRAAGAPRPPAASSAARVTDLAGAADLHAFGAGTARAGPVRCADQELTAGPDVGGRCRARRGLSQAVAGLTLWGAHPGLAAVGSGSMTVPLA